MNDLISKEDVKKLTKQMYLEIGPAKYDVHTISDCTSYVASKCRQYINEHLDDLPPVEPQEKVGKWVSTIVKEKGWNGKERQFYQPISCSVCRKPNHVESNYCPNCGAKMKGDKHE